MPSHPQALLLIWAFMCFLSYWIIAAARDHTLRPGPQLKTASTALLTIFALNPWRSGASRPGFQLIALGLALGGWAISR